MQLDSGVLSYLAGVTVRSAGLCLLTLAAMVIFRVRTAAARHALWTALVVGMLLTAALAPLAPPVALRVLSASPALSIETPDPPISVAETPTAAPVQPSTPAWRLPARTQIVEALYLAIAVALLIRLAFGYLFTRRLVRASRRTELGPGAIYESCWISVPLTLGWLRPKILLPAGWREWEAPKLAAVLAHERTHVKRADWGIALLAGMNRCLFWFHPLAWWLERRLAALAEQACDDAALLEMEAREPYAQALLDMAAAVKTGHGRLVWEAMAMAKASEVKMRIERILDDTRQIPRGVTRRRWATLAACSLPLIYLAAVVQLAPAQQTGKPEAQITTGVTAPKLTAADVSRMEQQLVSNPDDLETRSKLIAYYFLNGTSEPRLSHILWMIEHHPDSELTAFDSQGISPLPNSLNSPSDYQRATSLWQQQVAIHPKDPKVLANAGLFFGRRGGDFYEAERLLKQADDTSKLAALYSKALNVSSDASGALHFPALDENNPFANQVIGELRTSTDGMLLAQVASQLRAVPPNVTEQMKRMLQPRIDLGEELVAKAGELGWPAFGRQRAGALGTPMTIVNRMRDEALSKKSVDLSAVKPVDLSAAPGVLTKVDPPYPPLAQQARISGDVKLSVTTGMDGRVTSVDLISGPGSLSLSAMDAVKQWVFSPALQNGAPVPARFQVVVPFRLSEGAAPVPGSLPLANTPPPPPAPGTQDTKPPAPQRIRVGGNVQAASLIQKVDAVYPPQASTAGPNGEPLEGTVKLSIIIGKDGHVQSMTPIDGHPMLATAAEEAVGQWVYKTTRLNGNPVEVLTTVDVSFSAGK